MEKMKKKKKKRRKLAKRKQITPDILLPEEAKSAVESEINKIRAVQVLAGAQRLGGSTH
jgi:tripartite-type tricarboxylate transporter receptor subunit TctC